MKKLSFSLLLISILALFFSLTAYAAEGYVFSVTEDFPLPYSSSIEVVNARHGVFKADSLSDIEHLIEAGIVENYEPMVEYTLFEYTPSDKYYSNQTSHLSQAYVQFAWNKELFGEGVKIAVIDSGIYLSSADFKKIIPAYDATETASSKTTFCQDEVGHGSMVTGVLAAQHNAFGIAGVAPKSTVYAFKCFNSSKLDDQTPLINAIYSAIDDYECDIINMSWGGSHSPQLQRAIDYAYSEGAILVAAAGNDGSYTTKEMYPASYKNVISVGSLGADGHTASHSQRVDSVNILAPGENIYSVNPLTTTKFFTDNGTSYASPHVVGALALAKNLNPSLSREELINALYVTADSLPLDRFSGHGSLNIQSLLTYVKATLSPGNIYYSINNGKICFSFIPPEGVKSFFALYDDENILIYISGENFAKCSKNDYKFKKHYLWKWDSLSPYTYENIPEWEY